MGRSTPREGKAVQTVGPAHDEPAGGEIGWNVGGREGIGIFRSLLATRWVPLWALALEGKARALDLG